MNTFFNKALAKKVFFQGGLMWVELSDGRKLGVPLAYFPKLLQASDKQRQDYIISGGGKGLHWEALDEDISVEHLFLACTDRSSTSHPVKDMPVDRQQHL